MLEIVNMIHFHLSTAASLPPLLIPEPHKAPHKAVHLTQLCLSREHEEWGSKMKSTRSQGFSQTLLLSPALAVPTLSSSVP